MKLGANSLWDQAARFSGDQGCAGFTGDQAARVHWWPGLRRFTGGQGCAGSLVARAAPGSLVTRLRGFTGDQTACDDAVVGGQNAYPDRLIMVTRIGRGSAAEYRHNRRGNLQSW